mgnify:FL=1
MNRWLKEIIDIILTPISWIYGAVIVMRNKFFDWGFLKQHKFDIPVLVVGNINVGGTGKTPHVEYIVENLCAEHHLAVLSRGYKRKTKGFILATKKTTTDDIGDEPYQIYRKFGNLITVAVCEDRCAGIKELLEINPDIDLVVLDDAFQHRYVKPKASVVLVDYNNPVDSDYLLPRGRLREPRHGLLRADYVIVTKCPIGLKPVDISITKKRLDLFPSQKLYFSTLKYFNLVPIFPDAVDVVPSLKNFTHNDSILVVTGIANHIPFVKFLKAFKTNIKVIHFSDHHDYNRKDFEFIEKWFNRLKGNQKYLIVTEKDAVKFNCNPYYPLSLQPYSFYMPIKIGFIDIPHNGDFINSLKKSLFTAKK